MNIFVFLTQSEALFSFLIVVAIAILLFLVLRAIVLWYWKIDTIVSNQQKQIELLTKILLSLSEEK